MCRNRIQLMEGRMIGFKTGPGLLVHILIVTMVNALCLPLFYRWTGSILYAFFISVGVLAVYGAIASHILSGFKR